MIAASSSEGGWYARDAVVATNSFPVVALLEALVATRRSSSASRVAQVGSALGAVFASVGAEGAFLRVDAPGASYVAAGWGSLDAEPVVERPGLVRVTLRAENGRTQTGSLWIDSSAGDTTAAVRAIELAVEAARSRDELRRTARRLEALDAATQAIAGVLSLDRVLQVMVDRVRELIGARYAAIGIVDEHGVIERFVTSGITLEQRRQIGPLPRGHGLLGLIVRENRSYRIPDIARHRDSSGFPPNHPPMRSFLGVPIQVKGASVGNFYLTDKRHAVAFSAEDQRLVEMFALHAGVAIDNARLHEQVQRMAVVDERTRIGKDLHDGIIQGLYAVGLSLEDVPELMREDPADAAMRVDRAIDSVNLIIRDIRSFIFGLRPELAEQGGLVAGVAALAGELRHNTVIDVEFETDEDVPELAAESRGELLQVVREALSNVARHSAASRTLIALRVRDATLQVIVSDNGRGFEVAAHRPTSHQGLLNMGARAAALGGRLEVDTEPGAGTRIIIEVPVDIRRVQSDR